MPNVEAMETGVLDQPLSLSQSAARRIAEIVAAENNPDLKLRIAVSGGGCSGFQYGFTLDDTVNDDDLRIERDGATLLVDAVSLDFMRGAEVDFVEDLAGAAFQIRNPNAKTSCGCGTSFSV
jgi:iron-sulfur cluster insertion protein